MKISVLLYLCGDESEKRLEAALFSAGFRVCRIGNLSKLHTILESRSFAAVFLSRKTLRLYCINASRHLWKSRSPHTIIDWEADDGGAVSFSVHHVPSSATGILEAPDREQKLAAITALLEKINLGDTQTAAPEAEPQDRAPRRTGRIFDEKPDLAAIVAIPLHSKLRLVLETIAAAGTAGIGIAAIENRIWGSDGRDRKKDVQIYVSKLRKALTHDGTVRFTIPYENRRYYLRKQA